RGARAARAHAGARHDDDDDRPAGCLVRLSTQGHARPERAVRGRTRLLGLGGSMEVILLEDIGGLGKRGSAVKVADGYARNFLIPRKKAIEAVGNARAVFKDRERARVALEQKQRQAAE